MEWDINNKRVISRSLGTRIIVFDNGKLRITNALLIPSGAETPVSHSRDDYEVSSDGQEFFDVPLVEFESNDDFDVIGNFRFKCLPGAKRGDLIRVTFHHDASGIPTVEAFDLKSGKRLTGERLPYEEPDLEEINRRQASIKPRWVIFAVGTPASMDGATMNDMKKALLSNARDLLATGAGRCKIGIVSFSSSAQIICYPTSRYTVLEFATMTMTPAGKMIAMDEGVRQALDLVMVAPAGTERDVLIVIDSMPGNRRRRRTLNVAKEARSKGVNLSTVGIGEREVDLDFLRQISPLSLVISTENEYLLKQVNLLTLIANGKKYAPSDSPWRARTVLRYRLSSGKGHHKGKGMRLTWSVENPFANCAGFTLRADHTGVPASLDDGIELFRWKPGESSISGKHEAWVSLAPIHQHRWAYFYCKLMMIDPAQRHSTLIIHPNTCLPIAETGEVCEPKSRNKLRGQRAQMPREVICAGCSEKFPVEHMLFGGNPELMPARHAWINRLLGQPPQPPMNKYGQRLTANKMCPCCGSFLPFTAGEQETLIIGSIGANYSGHSTYIASLIKLLSGQVAEDFMALVGPASGYTEANYRHGYHDPLFINRSQLAKTSVVSPLFYELALHGRLWGEERGCARTLAFQDVPGEHFSNVKRVMAHARHLRGAAGILFLIDPLQSPSVRIALPPSIRLIEEEVYIVNNVEIISRVMAALWNARSTAQTDSLSIPIAVVLTKCDVLRDVRLIDTNRLWSTDARHVGYFNTEIHNDMTGMWGEYIQRWFPEVYNNVRQRFSRHAFFGVSSTGCALEKMRFNPISPWRVEDPLLWLLAELGVIPVR